MRDRENNSKLATNSKTLYRNIRLYSKRSVRHAFISFTTSSAINNLQTIFDDFLTIHFTASATNRQPANAIHVFRWALMRRRVLRSSAADSFNN